jgi:hypothetical protein
LLAQARFAYNSREKTSLESLSTHFFYDSAKSLLWLRQEGNGGSENLLDGNSVFVPEDMTPAKPEAL